MLIKTNDPDILARVNALVNFLRGNDRPSDYPNVEAEGHDVEHPFAGAYGGYLIELQDGTEFYVLTDDEADTYLRAKIEEYIDEAPGSVRLDNAEYLDADDKEKLMDAQESGCSEQVRAVLKSPRYLQGAFDQEKRQGRGYMISSYDGKEHKSGDFYIYRQN